MTRGPVLLAADPAWDTPGGGAVILRSLVGDRLGRDVVWATPSRVIRDPGRGLYGLRAGSLGRTGRHSVFWDSVRHAGALADELLALAAQVDAAGLWVVLHGSMVPVARRLAAAGRYPLHATVHDDPAYANALRSRRYLALVPLVARDFAFALRRAASVDVVGAGMARRYERLYGVKSVVVHRALSEPVPPAPPYELGRVGLTVGVLGSTYSFAPLPVLAEAVARAAGGLGVAGRLVVCGGGGHGARLQARFAGRLAVEPLGHLAEADGIAALRNCAALYLNYPFGRLDRVLRETSFPTKLSTYVYAARPLLVHAPAGSSVSELPGPGGYVAPWRSMDPADGAACLAGLAGRPGFSESFHAEAEALRLRYYDAAAHRETMGRLLAALPRTRA